MAGIVVYPPPILIAPPTGTSRLHVVELDKSLVAKPNRRVRLGRTKRKTAVTSFGNPSATLLLNAWTLFHAASKTEFATSFSAPDAIDRALRTAGLHNSRFVWNTTNLRKTDDNVFALEEFADAGLAGRIGEAVAYLMMVGFGYAYWDRASTVMARAFKAAKISHPEELRAAKAIGKPVRRLQPDFVFEKISGEVALMESKGGFVNDANDRPSTKRDLSKALTQLGAWSGVVSPPPSKSFAFGTYIRDESDKKDVSLVAYVDPPGEESADIPSAQIPPDLIRRCNYGAWLRGMGFSRSGAALRDLLEIATAEVNLPVLNIRGRKYATVVLGYRSSPAFPFGWSPMDMPPFHFDLPRTLLVMGLDANVLRNIGNVLRNPVQSSLHEQELKGQVEPSTGRPDEPYQGQWSAMPDGSCVGVVGRDVFAKGLSATETFYL